MKLDTLFKKAFTLAEVLITLTIIGVVAAMTIPTLMSKYKEQEALTKLKKAQSVLANAIASASIKEGLLFYGEDSIEWGEESEKHNAKAIFNELKTNYACYEAYGSGCTLNPNNIVGEARFLARTDDGMIFGTHLWFNDILVNISPDYKNPGKNNVYSFEFTKDYTLIPRGIPSSSRPLKKADTCPQTNGWSGCTYWTLVTGKVKKNAGEWDERLGSESSS